MDRGPHDLKGQLSSLVEDIMLSERMAKVLTNIFRGQADALRAEMKTMVDDAMRGHRKPVIPPRRALEAETGVSCSLADCGDDSPCSEWNKELENVDDCGECGNKKWSVNSLFACTCTYSCAAPVAARHNCAEHYFRSSDFRLNTCIVHSYGRILILILLSALRSL